MELMNSEITELTHQKIIDMFGEGINVYEYEVSAEGIDISDQFE